MDRSLCRFFPITSECCKLKDKECLARLVLGLIVEEDWLNTKDQPTPIILNGEECFWPVGKANLGYGQDLIVQIPGQRHTVQN
jgi:hypothetical protein